ncbi:L,D-transpeptidase family protein [Natronosporangium hydrolyticum]|uniref:L,D-transpeptidase family protein n=1 Tax=Natronosporangium hydrolyticum TaxID=2811111 RepID=A0A895YPN5_9ACTN|nr:L,D-transpeptidase family protein [Natronosporangium hydrolyticum]
MALAVLLPAVLVLSGCSSNGDGEGGDPEEGPHVGATILEPADATSGVPTALEIHFDTEHATEATVELADLDGNPIEGEPTESGTSWLPQSQLEYQTTYVATLTAVGDDGQNSITTSTFTTMAEPSQTIRVFSFLGADSEVGVGMPLRIEFKDDADQGWDIPEAARAEIERRITVRTDPPQAGGWHWVRGSELHYRPMEFWEPGTQISYRAAAGGLPLGDDYYLRNDLNLNLTVGRSVIMEVDDATREMTVKVDGEVERTIPVSLGRDDYPSSSGTFVIMEKESETVFDTLETMGEEDGYVVDIEYAMRLTYQGEYIHATVRSGEELGNENVTHGCINMSEDNAEWLFDLTNSWGDPVIVTGTSQTAEPGDGWTDWNLDWEEIQRGSALYSEG